MEDLITLNKKIAEAEKIIKENFEKKENKKTVKRDPTVEPIVNVEFDELKMYFGEPIVINTNDDTCITIYQPTIGEILEFGEKKMFASIIPFTTNTTSYRLQLWEMGIDWNKISNFDLFAWLINGLNVDSTKLLFGDIDFSKLSRYELKKKDENGEFIINENGQVETEIVLFDPSQNLLINEETYIVIREHLRFMFNQYPKEEYVKGKMTKQWVIDEEREKLRFSGFDSKQKTNKSFLLPLISSLVNHAGFKFRPDELRNVGIVQFMDSVKRLQVYEQSTAFLKGMYSGMLDTSKMSPEELNNNINWQKDIFI